MFIPLLFWCNQDPRLSVPSVAIPYGQRFINMTLATKAQMVAGDARDPNATSSPITVTVGDVTVSSIVLYINNIFVNPEIHDIFIRRIGFTLIRVHRQQTYNAEKASDDVLLQQLKWPIETLFVGMKVKAYHNGTSTEARTNLDKWHKFTTVTNTSYTTQGWNGLEKAKSLTFDETGYFVWGAPVAYTTDLVLVTGTPTAGTKTTITDSGSGLAANGAAGDYILIINSGRFIVSEINAVAAGTITLAADQFEVENATGLDNAADISVSAFLIQRDTAATLEDETSVRVAASAGTLDDQVAAGDKVVVNGLELHVDSVAAAAISFNESQAHLFFNVGLHIDGTLADRVIVSDGQVSYRVYTNSPLTVTVPVETLNLDTVTIKAHGIPIYNLYPSQFFNAYVPLHYGGQNIQTPSDKGALMVTFNLYPGSYQPSGHINVSRAREFYLSYVSSTISSSVNGTLVVVAEAINFLLISDGSAVLRYST